MSLNLLASASHHQIKNIIRFSSVAAGIVAMANLSLINSNISSSLDVFRNRDHPFVWFANHSQCKELIFFIFSN